MADKLLKIATVTAAHGIGGEVRLKVFLEDKDSFAGLGPYSDVAGNRLNDIVIRGQSKGQLIVRVAETNTRDAAEALKGLNLYIPRDRLPEPEEEEEFYYEDLIGLQVWENGEQIGVIKSLRDHGAGDLVEIEFPNAKTDYFAFSLANFPEIHLTDGWVAFVRPSEIISQDNDGKVH